MGETANTLGRIRTCGPRFRRPPGYSVAADNAASCSNGLSNTSNAPSNELQNDPHLTSLADALATLPKADRPAIIDHVRILAQMNPAKRAAVLTLVADDG